MQNQYVTIDSRDRSAGTSTQFRVILPDGIHNIRQVKLLGCDIPNTVYNITTNNMLTFTRAGTTYIATLTPAAYTKESFPGAIAACMNAVDPNAYTCTYNPSTLKMTIAGGSAFVLNLSSANSPWYEMGFTQNDTSAATSITSPNVMNLSLPISLYIEIPQIGLGSTSSRANDRCTFRIPMNAIAGEFVYFQQNANYEQCYKYSSVITLANFDVRLRTRNGSTVELNGGDWQLYLELGF